MTEAIVAAFVGLLIGSFLNVCIYRLPRDLSVVRPRSFCPSCQAAIAWYDNVPVVSYLVLRGRCRHCRAKIPWRYPLVELMTAACFFLAIHQYGFNPAGLKFCVFSALLTGLIFADFEERILPDEMTLGGIAAGLLFAYLSPNPSPIGFLLLPLGTSPQWLSVAGALIGAIVCSGAIWLIGAAYYRIRHREGLGLGDVKMIAMIGAFLGLLNAMRVLIAGSILGAVVGVLFIVLARKDASSYELPYGSFLGIAALIVTLVFIPASGF